MTTLADELSTTYDLGPGEISTPRLLEKAGDFNKIRREDLLKICKFIGWKSTGWSKPKIVAELEKAAAPKKIGTAPAFDEQSKTAEERLSDAEAKRAKRLFDEEWLKRRAKERVDNLEIMLRGRGQHVSQQD